MLKVANLTKQYPTPRGPLAVLSDVSFSLAPGDAAAIMGPSGSGKSSLLYVLGALEPPTSGTVTLDGRDPFQLPAAQLAAFRNESVGFVFQDHCLLPQCTVLENVLIPTLVAANGGADATDRARQLVDRDGKLAFLQTLDLLSVPATYDEPKGVFLLEAMASGVPVVQPRRGAFTEIVEKTGGGLLVAPGDPQALADGLFALWSDRARSDALGARGFEGVRAHYSVQHSADRMMAVYETMVSHPVVPQASH